MSPFYGTVHGERCGDNGLMLIRVRIENLSRTAISGGKRPNPSDLGS